MNIYLCMYMSVGTYIYMYICRFPLSCPTRGVSLHAPCPIINLYHTASAAFPSRLQFLFASFCHGENCKSARRARTRANPTFHEEDYFVMLGNWLGAHRNTIVERLLGKWVLDKRHCTQTIIESRGVAKFQREIQKREAKGPIQINIIAEQEEEDQGGGG